MRDTTPRLWIASLNQDLFCGIFDGDDWIVSGAGRWLDRELRSTKVDPDFVDERVLREKVKSGKPLNKIMFRGDPHSILNAKVKLSSFLGQFTCYSNKCTILEYLPSGASKARGVSTILGLPVGNLADVVAFGDGYNDVALMHSAEFSVAMGNAVEECRAAAKYETRDNNSDGIAMFLESFLTEQRFVNSQ